jgi:hypothetical protein
VSHSIFNHRERPTSSIELLVLCSLAMLLLGCAAFMWSSPHKHPGPMTGQHPAPYHIEWDEYPVGGMVLGQPEGDSTGVHHAVRLPAGSLLEVPREVEGRDSVSPDSIRWGA